MDGNVIRLGFVASLLRARAPALPGIEHAGPLMPWTPAFAAGAMLFIISDETIPETHRGGYQDLATFSLLGGFGLVIILDATLG